MSRFAVVKFSDSVYGTRVEIYGEETFKSFDQKSFYNMMAGMDVQSITWFDDTDEALSFFRELGGSEFLAVTRGDDFPYPIHVLDTCPFSSRYFVKDEFKTIDAVEKYCKDYVDQIEVILF